MVDYKQGPLLLFNSTCGAQPAGLCQASCLTRTEWTVLYSMQLASFYPNLHEALGGGLLLLQS